MAQKVSIVLTDDLDGSDAAETISFSLEGSSYEIDLSEQNANRLRDALRPFIDAGRRTTGRAKGTTPRRRSSKGGQATDIRAWAAEQGMNVSARGRVPAPIRAAYEAAH